MDITTMGIREQRDLLDRHEISVKELTECYLNRIETYDPALQSYITVTKEQAYQDGSGRMNIGPGHMYSYITPIFICDQVDEDARKALKKCRIYKSFHFSLHGWMDFHAALVDLGHDRFDSNRAGKTTVKILKKVLLHQKK